jgi:RNA polymerase sigma-70 factor (ECF subfamily)
VGNPESAERPAPEAELSELIANGDRKRALSVLMDRYGADVRRSAVSRIGDDHAAEDVRQQVFLEAYRDLGQLSEAGSAKAWLLGITRHRSLDAAKKRTKWWRVFQQPQGDQDGDESDRGEIAALDPDPERMLETAMMVKILRYCLAKLGPAAREAVTLCYGQDLSHEEVATIVGDRAGTVQKRISRALLALRTCIYRRIGGTK